MKDTLLRNPGQLGRALRLKRQEQGISQVALAARLGVERKWIIHLEAGNPKAELGLVLRALDALNFQASMRDKGVPQAGEPGSSRLDEVFERLRRPERK